MNYYLRGYVVFVHICHDDVGNSVYLECLVKWWCVLEDKLSVAYFIMDLAELIVFNRLPIASKVRLTYLLTYFLWH